MTNSSPPEPQNPMPERRKRPATGVTFDEMIAMIVAFSTIGTILFWSMGGKNSKLANNLGLGGGNNLLTADKTVDTGLGFGNILSAQRDDTAGLDQDLAAENRRLSDQLEQQETEVSSSPFNQAANRRARSQVNNRSFGFNPGAKLAPVAGVATLPAWRRQFNNQQPSNQGAAGKDSSNQAPGEEGKAADTAKNGKAPTSETESESAALDPSQPQQAETDAPGTESPSAAAPNQVETDAPEAEPPSAAAPNQAETDAPEAESPSAAAPNQEETATKPETTTIAKDVAPDYWAYPFVKAMKEKALVPELGKNQKFEPDALITRAGMATLVSQAFNQQPATAGTKKFKDVSNNNAVAKDIDRAVSSGFMQGYSDDEFKPLENIPRYQVLVTLATGLGLKPSGNAETILQKFGDSSQMPDWAKQQVAAATEAGLVVNPPNTPANSLVPEKPATKAEVAAMIHQALVSTGQLKSIESEFIVKP